jgi:hypothetical protein
MVNEVPQRLDECWNGTPRSSSPRPGKDDAAVAVNADRHLGGQVRLPHPGLAAKQRNAALPGRSFPSIAA